MNTTYHIHDKHNKTHTNIYMHSNLLKLYNRRIQHNTYMTNIIKDTQICIYNIYLTTERV